MIREGEVCSSLIFLLVAYFWWFKTLRAFLVSIEPFNLLCSVFYRKRKEEVLIWAATLWWHLYSIGEMLCMFRFCTILLLSFLSVCCLFLEWTSHFKGNLCWEKCEGFHYLCVILKMLFVWLSGWSCGFIFSELWASLAACRFQDHDEKHTF